MVAQYDKYGQRCLDHFFAIRLESFENPPFIKKELFVIFLKSTSF